MSRGLGQFQRTVLAKIDAAAPGTNINRIQWELADESGAVRRDAEAVGPFESGRLSPAFYGSFRRALRTSVEIKERLARRRCADFDELNGSYPYKSLQLHVRQLRERVLPLMQEYLEANGKRQFKAADTEIYLADTKIPDDAISKAASEWSRIKERALAVTGDLRGDAQSAFFEVLIKAEQLFRNKSIRHDKPLPRLLRAASEELDCRRSAVPIQTLHEIGAIYDAAIPKELRRHATFKSRLCSIIDFGQNRTRAAFKPEFKTWLLERDPDMITALPEHKASRSRVPRGFQPIGADLSTRFSPMLDQAIGRDALQAQLFIAAA